MPGIVVVIVIKPARSLRGIAPPMPEEVYGVGIAKVAVFRGLDVPYMFPDVAALLYSPFIKLT